MNSLKKVLILHLGKYSNVWSEAIEGHARYKTTTVDFSTALFLTKKEYSRIGLFSKVDTIKDGIKTELGNFDKRSYHKTYELYGVTSQLIALIEEPKGSLMTFNSRVNQLDSNFSNSLALAELEL